LVITWIWSAVGDLDAEECEVCQQGGSEYSTQQAHRLVDWSRPVEHEPGSGRQRRSAPLRAVARALALARNAEFTCASEAMCPVRHPSRIDLITGSGVLATPAAGVA
jgi:hypothetical protein